MTPGWYTTRRSRVAHFYEPRRWRQYLKVAYAVCGNGHKKPLVPAPDKDRCGVCAALVARRGAPIVGPDTRGRAAEATPAGRGAKRATTRETA